MLVFTNLLGLTHSVRSDLEMSNNTRTISWDVVIWALEAKYIVDICRSVEMHFALDENSVLIA